MLEVLAWPEISISRALSAALLAHSHPSFLYYSARVKRGIYR